MKRLLVTAITFCITLCAMAQGQYRNPIIPGYHPDPSICRVGDTFYLVNSSFEYFPGVPIFKSQDLIHWTQLGNVLTRDSQLPLKGATSWLGIYAPTIRYNDGTWYMITTNVGNGGNFLVTAKQPEGPWSEPVWLKQQGIDPSLYFEDGHCYMVSNPNSALALCEIDPVSGKQLTESKPIWRGDGGRYVEGPHIYKKDGYYYLLASEGGTELNHHLTIARSRSIWGPYESNPANPILTNCNYKGQDEQIQGTGHGDFVQAADGSWWIVFLAYRNFGGSYHHLGRETYLAPVEWKEGEWPVIYGGEAISSRMTVDGNQTLIKGDMTQAVKSPQPAFHVPQKAFGPEWCFIQNPIRENYEFIDGGLRLHGSTSSLTENLQPTFVGMRQDRANYTAEVEVRPKNVEAGLTVYQINDGHFDLFVDKGQIAVRCQLKAINYIAASRLLVKSRPVKLRIRSDQDMYYFEYSSDDKPFQELCRLNCSLLSTEVAGGFTGVFVGMYAQGKGYADFK